MCILLSHNGDVTIAYNTLLIKRLMGQSQLPIVVSGGRY